MKELQEVVKVFFQHHEMSENVNARLHALASEVGELAKEHNKATQYGAKEFVPHKDWVLEMGDVLFVLICLANQTNVDLETAIRAAMFKMETRFREHGRIGSA